MINNNITVAKDDLNSYETQVIDSYIDKTENLLSGGTKTVRIFPKRIQVFNDTGIDIEVDFILTQYEFDDYEANPTDKKYFLIKTGTVWSVNSFYPLPNPYKLLVRGVSAGTATKDLRIDLIGFFPL